MKMPTNKVPKVFLDANVVIQARKPPGGPILDRVKDLVEANLITVLTTDLTITEVAKQHAQNDYEIIKEVGRPHFRKIVEEVLGTKLPDTTKPELMTKLAEAYEQSTKAMFNGLRAKMLSIDSIKPSVVFSAYARSQGFFSGDGKKDQFPDAFLFECLKSEASEEEPVIIVSNDGDFNKPVEGQAHISLVNSLPDLFKTLKLQVDAPQVIRFLEEHQQELVAAVDSELSDWGLIGDIEDSDIEETHVTNVEVDEITSFGSAENAGSILAVGRLRVTANISYTHPNLDNAIWDSRQRTIHALRD
jgi:hypothetical protein